MALRVFIASDHGGFLLKTQLLPMIVAPDMDVIDLGTCDDKSVDYPDFAMLLCRRVLDTPGSLGILICGTGIGMSMAANRIPGIRAALCTDSTVRAWPAPTTTRTCCVWAGGSSVPIWQATSPEPSFPPALKAAGTNSGLPASMPVSNEMPGVRCVGYPRH